MISSSVRNLRTSHEQNNTGGQNISNKPQPLPLLFPNETAELTHVLSGSLAKYNQKRQDAVQAAKPKGPWHKTPSKKVQDIIRKYFPTPVDPKRKFHALKPKCPAGEQGLVLPVKLMGIDTYPKMSDYFNIVIPNEQEAEMVMMDFAGTLKKQ